MKTPGLWLIITDEAELFSRHFQKGDKSSQSLWLWTKKIFFNSQTFLLASQKKRRGSPSCTISSMKNISIWPFIYIIQTSITSPWLLNLMASSASASLSNSKNSQSNFSFSTQFMNSSPSSFTHLLSSNNKDMDNVSWGLYDHGNNDRIGLDPNYKSFQPFSPPPISPSSYFASHPGLNPTEFLDSPVLFPTSNVSSWHWIVLVCTWSVMSVNGFAFVFLVSYWFHVFSGSCISYNWCFCWSNLQLEEWFQWQSARCYWRGEKVQWFLFPDPNKASCNLIVLLSIFFKQCYSGTFLYLTFTAVLYCKVSSFWKAKTVHRLTLLIFVDNLWCNCKIQDNYNDFVANKWKNWANFCKIHITF